MKLALGMVAGVVIFFFQAEDGIRDIGVTGVQTCALPIWSGRMIEPPEVTPLSDFTRDAAAAIRRLKETGQPEVLTVDGKPAVVVQDAAARSEERRVGKECRSRWSQYH